MEMLGGGKEVAAQCRTPEIMADAAYVILTRYDNFIEDSFRAVFSLFLILGTVAITRETSPSMKPFYVKKA